MSKGDNDYFEFLYKTGFDDDEHRALAGYLHTIPFDWFNAMDENRMYDGLAMRREFDESITGKRFNMRLDKDRDLDIYSKLKDNACTMLEFFVGFAFRLSRDMYSNIQPCELVEMWLRNLDIWRFDDYEDYGDDEIMDEIDECLDIWVKCEYDRHGNGGLFRLFDPPEDLYDVEMWVQASWWYDEVYGE